MGESVWALNLRPGPRWVTATISEVRSPVSYVVRLCGGDEWRRHVDQLRVRDSDSVCVNPENELDILDHPSVSTPTPSQGPPRPVRRNPPRARRPPDRYGQWMRQKD